jgi:hypothetical protein
LKRSNPRRQLQLSFLNAKVVLAKPSGTIKEEISVDMQEDISNENGVIGSMAGKKAWQRGGKWRAPRANDWCPLTSVRKFPSFGPKANNPPASRLIESAKDRPDRD